MLRPYIEVCNMPWDTIIFYSDGQYGVCSGGKIGKIDTEEDVRNLWNSQPIMDLRGRLLRCESEGMCVNCNHFKTTMNSEYVDTTKSMWGIPRPVGAKEIWGKLPRSIGLDITSKCNLRCFMCRDQNINPMDDRYYKSMPIKYIEWLAKYYFKGLDTLNTNCYGELFVYEYLDDFFDIIKRYRPKHVITSSSGSLKIGMETWKKIMDTHDSISFSVDSVSKSIHDEIRGFNMDRLFENLEKINYLKKDYPNFTYGFSMVVMKKNLHEMFEFTKTAIEKWGGTKVNFQNISGHPEESVLLDNEWKKKYNEELRKVREYKENVSGKIEIAHLEYAEIEKTPIIEAKEIVSMGKDKQLIKTSGIISIVKEKRKKSMWNVGAFYYPWYKKNEWDQYVRRNLKDPLYPIFGEYESIDEKIFNNQCFMAKENNIDFFISSWSKNEGHISDINLKKIVSNGKLPFGMKFSLLYETGHIIHLDNFEDVFLSEMLSVVEYFKHEDYLIIEGKPVIFFYITRDINKDYEKLFSNVRRIFKYKGFKDVIIIGDEVWWDINHPNYLDEDKVKTFDAVFAYNMYVHPCKEVPWNKENPISFLDNVFREYDNYYSLCKRIGLDFIPSSFPRFNDRGVRNYQNKDIIQDNGKFFESFLDRCMKYDNKYNMHLIASWNEWYDDTQLEPCFGEETSKNLDPNFDVSQGITHYGYGYKDLETVKRVFSNEK